MPSTTQLLLAVAICSVGALALTKSSEFGYRPLGSISIPRPSFVRVLPCGSTTKSNSLWVTQCAAVDPGKVNVIDNVAQYYPDFSSAEYTTVASNFKWPNYISVAPAQIGDYLVAPDGFMVPGKDYGGVYLIPATCSRKGGATKDAAPVQLTPKESYFYHKVEWRDMNHDGKLDILTAHAKKPLFGSGQGQLVWLEQPTSDPLKNVPWNEHVLLDGPDIWFISVDLNTHDNFFEVFVTEFFAEVLSVLIINNKVPKVIASRVIDPDIGPAYTVSMVDLNLDGKQELLVSNHVGGGAGGGVYAYEIPDDVIKGDFKKHTLAENFTVTESGFNQAAPGFPYAILPHTKYTGKPYILVAGDGSQKAYMMYPTDTDFEYKLSVIISCKGVIGSIGYGDIIGNDGWTEFFVPDYDDGRLYAYTFAPE